MKKKRKVLSLIAIIFFTLVSLILFFLLCRASFIEIDDISPGINCSNSLIQKSDVLWVIPMYENKSIANDKEWCQYILSLNKTLGMHGVTHEFKEFGTDRSQEYLEEGIRAFKDCFNQTPIRFKPPQLEISKNNKILVDKNGMSLKLDFNHIVHKVYHCEDTGTFSNRFLDWV